MRPYEHPYVRRRSLAHEISEVLLSAFVLFLIMAALYLVLLMAAPPVTP
jgi:hypothetical protein